MTNDVNDPTQEEKQSWIGLCAIRYCATFAIGWVVTAALAPPGEDPHQPDTFAEMSRWASFKDYMSASPGMFLLIAVPSLIILLVIGYRGQKMPAEQFRVTTGALLMIPLWVMLVSGSLLLLVVQVVFQGLFAAIMPPPLAPRRD
ncbi:hypothetical protein [Streptomyces xanthochromogenes]|uniref:hypothetical protein n=1 Tax=Streptomyces xanthochromogenes TaxID=67384 RepID=UPI003437FED0